MKFRCERDTLSDAVSTAQRAVASRTGALPVLSGLRVTLTELLRAKRFRDQDGHALGFVPDYGEIADGALAGADLLFFDQVQGQLRERIDATHAHTVKPA